MHNALEQTTLTCGQLTISGFSISGLATYLQVPAHDVCFDMGECPLSALPLRHVLLTHAHGDHARCLLRHRALRGMLGLTGEACYLMPAAIADDFAALARADARFEGVDDDAYSAPLVVPLHAGQTIPLPFRPTSLVHAFSVDHRGVPSLGYTILERRKKLKAAFVGLDGQAIAALRSGGTEVSDVVDTAVMTFIGDCIGESLVQQAHIWDSPVLVIEATFVAPDDREMAARKGHTHIDEIGAVIASRGPSALPAHIVLKHFSMKVTRAEIDDAVARAIPAFAHDRIKVLAR